MKNKVEYPFDFTLYVNNKIICKRHFWVCNFNKNQTYDLYSTKEMILECTLLIDDFDCQNT